MGSIVVDPATYLASRLSVGASLSSISFRGQARREVGPEIHKDVGGGGVRIDNPRPEDIAALLAQEEVVDAPSEVVGLNVAVDLKMRRSERPATGELPFERALLDARTLFLDHLHPWDAPGISREPPLEFDSAGRPIDGTGVNGPGVRTVFGHPEGAARLEVYLSPANITRAEFGQRSLRLELSLTEAGCVANGIRDFRSLISINVRRVFGRYFDIVGRHKGVALGELNSRVKRELSRMMIRLGGATIVGL